MQIQLSWEDPKTRQLRKPTLSPPIALGRVFPEMPEEIDGRRVSRIVLQNDNRVSRYHVLIDRQQENWVAIDCNSGNGMWVNGTRQREWVLAQGDVLQIGWHQITVSLKTPEAAKRSLVILFNPDTGMPDVRGPLAPTRNFPAPEFCDAQSVSLAYLRGTQQFDERTDTFDYATIGAGLGSYIWADFLRIFGVRSHQITAIGTQAQPYAKYKQLCLNSQIPLYERLRSNSDSCPDNIWGWPPYALREAWQNLRRGRVAPAGRHLWQVFAEPTFAETYTPRADNVFESIDREAARIGWDRMYRYGSVRSLRKTDDGRYAIAYSKGGGEYGFAVAKYVHLATGYPAIRFLDHLQAYRDNTNDLKSVVNAYEPHDFIYEHLERQGGTVVIQGRGIVASRIIQRLYEVRRNARQEVTIVHLMRSPLKAGHRFGRSQRTIRYNWEFQPFNWPKACWGGDLREILENANPAERAALIEAWGGTTTADRQDWQQLTALGLREGWYKIQFGRVKQVEKVGTRLQVIYTETENGQSKGSVMCKADFIIDATGLDAEVKASPFLEDLVDRYQLPLLANGRFSTSNDFELVEMRSPLPQVDPAGGGRMYAVGAITLGGPYAAVDSFLGLQYAALRSVDDLIAAQAPRLRYLNGVSSALQWWKWAMNRSP
ncbi:MAG: FHA domain-containing protein [Cyanobacteriota bacterium]|nr:FHA domain-containing protein [Cyanobacteriota bacterium]